MAELLGLADGELGDAVARQVLAHGAVDGRRLHQEARRNAQVAVVLHHAGEEHVRPRAPLEGRELLVLESARDLDGAVAPEVEADDPRAVADRPERRAGVVQDHERRQELVREAGLLLAEGFDGFARAGEAAGFAQDMRLPAALDDAPVGFVAVHGDQHAATARGDPVVAAFGAQLGQQGLQGLHVVQGAGFVDVPAVEQHVDPGALHTVGIGPAQHRREMIHVAVDVAVREQPDQVQGLACAGDLTHQLAPDRALEEAPGAHGFAHQRGALGEDPPGTQVVVTDLAVSHVGVGGHAGGQAVGLQRRRGRLVAQPVQVRRLRRGHGVCAVAAPDPDAVHHAHHHGPGHGRERRMLAQGPVAHVWPLRWQVAGRTQEGRATRRRAASPPRRRSARAAPGLGPELPRS